MHAAGPRAPLTRWRRSTCAGPTPRSSATAPAPEGPPAPGEFRAADVTRRARRASWRSTQVCFHRPWTRADYERELADPARCFLFVARDLTARSSPIARSGESSTKCTSTTSPCTRTWRRQGVGRALLDPRACGEAAGLGAPEGHARGAGVEPRGDRPVRGRRLRAGRAPAGVLHASGGGRADPLAGAGGRRFPAVRVADLERPGEAVLESAQRARRTGCRDLGKGRMSCRHPRKRAARCWPTTRHSVNSPTDHHSLDDRLKVLATKPHLTDDEQFEEVTLKKEKLRLKDQMEALVRRHQSGTARARCPPDLPAVTAPVVTHRRRRALSCCCRADRYNPRVLTIGLDRAGWPFILGAVVVALAGGWLGGRWWAMPGGCWRSVPVLLPRSRAPAAGGPVARRVAGRRRGEVRRPGVRRRRPPGTWQQITHLPVAARRARQPLAGLGPRDARHLQAGPLPAGLQARERGA